MKKIIFSIIIILVLSSILVYYYKNSDIISSECLPMYQEMIDSVMNSGNRTSAEYIALDLDSFIFLDNKDQELLINYTKRYHPIVFKSSYKELNSNEYIDDSGWNLKGYFITISNFKKTGNTIKLEISRLKESLGAIGYCYRARYNGNQWKLKETCVFMS